MRYPNPNTESRSSIVTNALAYAEMVESKGYKVLEPTPTICKSSECADYVGVAGERACRVWVNNDHTYAYVAFYNGQTCDGSWHQFPDGSFTLG